MKQCGFVKIILGLLGVLFLVGCGGGGESAPSPNPIVSISSNVSSLLLSTSATLTWSSTHTTSCSASDSWTGTKATSGSQSVTPTSAGANTFTVTCAGAGGSLAKSVVVSTKSDPLYQYQWHLNNTGRINFATSPGTIGIDLNLDSVISSGINGSGIIVAVVDSGLEIGHEDLSTNIVSNKSYDYSNGDNNPEELANTETNPGGHGTSVAGIIAAVAGNDIGIRGVAPSAKLVGFNLIAGTNFSVTRFEDALSIRSGGADTTEVDIFNMSFGPDTSVNFGILLNNNYEAALKNGVENLRNNKGAIYVAASGNSWRNNGSFCGPNSSINDLMPCWDVSFGNYAQVPYVISVAALDAIGRRSTYSTTGSAIWVTGIGGEYGFNSSYKGRSYDYWLLEPAIMTVDQSSCSKGYVETGSYRVDNNSFNSAVHAENANCNYTSTFNGTSAAAPTVSGVIALMLDANENLSWRDVKHILANTSTQVELSRTKTYGGVNQYSWITNAAGYKHHNWYGFGKIDAAAAVTAAKNYSTNLGSFVNTNLVSGGVGTWTDPCNAEVNCNTSVTISAPASSNGKVEFVQVRVGITKTDPEHLGLELESPDGTKVPILTPFTMVRINPNATEFVLGVNAFYGENMAGIWKLHLTDYVSDSIGGELNSFRIKIYGN